MACDQVRSGMLDYRIASNHTNDEFDRLGVNINRMLDWNKALILTIKESINAIAHDMRTPLSHLRLELRALSERHALTEDARLAVLSHVERVDELINMFDNLLNIAKAESRASTELFEPFDMSQLVRDIVDFYQPIIDEKKISCVMNLPKTTAIIKGDKQLLGQAIMNLLDNACKYTPTQGLIQVTLSQSDGLTTFTMTDNGQGIPEHLLERAKERFFRADCSRNSSGHGLGLSLVNAVAHLHQGFLELSNHQPGLMVRLVMQSDHIKKL